MNAKQLIAAVFALTAATSAFADQNVNHVYTGKTRADVIAAKQQVQKTGITNAGKFVKTSTQTARGQQAGE